MQMVVSYVEDSRRRFPFARHIDVFDIYYKHASMDQLYFMVDPYTVKLQLTTIARFPLNIRERFTASLAPATAEIIAHFESFMEQYRSNSVNAVRLNITLRSDTV